MIGPIQRPSRPGWAKTPHRSWGDSAHMVARLRVKPAAWATIRPPTLVAQCLLYLSPSSDRPRGNGLWLRRRFAGRSCCESVWCSPCSVPPWARSGMPARRWSGVRNAGRPPTTGSSRPGRDWLGKVAPPSVRSALIPNTWGRRNGPRSPASSMRPPRAAAAASAMWNAAITSRVSQGRSSGPDQQVREAWAAGFTTTSRLRPTRPTARRRLFRWWKPSRPTRWRSRPHRQAATAGSWVRSGP